MNLCLLYPHICPLCKQTLLAPPPSPLHTNPYRYSADTLSPRDIHTMTLSSLNLLIFFHYNLYDYKGRGPYAVVKAACLESRPRSGFQVRKSNVSSPITRKKIILWVVTVTVLAVQTQFSLYVHKDGLKTSFISCHI